MTQTVEMAHSELRALIAKAARGAGLSWGLAEEAGWAADWLARRGMPAAEWSASWLASALEGQSNPVETGVRLADRFASCEKPLGSEIVPDGITAPGFMLPFFHLMALRFGPLDITGRTGRAALLDKDGNVTFGPAWAERTFGWSISPASDAPRPRRSHVSISVVECLEGLALQTTVPPSDQSRRDAGSAATDND